MVHLLGDDYRLSAAPEDLAEGLSCEYMTLQYAEPVVAISVRVNHAMVHSGQSDHLDWVNADGLGSQEKVSSEYCCVKEVQVIANRLRIHCTCHEDYYEMYRIAMVTAKLEKPRHPGLAVETKRREVIETY